MKRINWKFIIGTGILCSIYYYWSDAFRRKVVKIINEWELEVGLSEKEYRSNLAHKLRIALPKSSILEENGFQRSKVDIAISEFKDCDIDYQDRFSIELKLKLSNNNELNRLIGQLVSYKQEGYNLSIVVAIQFAANFQELLEQRTKAEGLDGFVIIIKK